MTEKLQLLSDKEVSGSGKKWAKLALIAITKCPKIKKEREIAILIDRFGIGKKAKTLHAIGVTYGVTRERIRQIVNNAIKKIQKNCQSEELKKNVNLIEKKIHSAGGAMTQADLATAFGVFDPIEKNALYFCAGLSNKLWLVKESKDFNQSWAQKNIKSTKIREVTSKALTFLKESKKTESPKIIAGAIGSEPLLVSAVLSIAKQTMKTDDGKWGLTVWPHVNPKSIRDKSKYVMTRHGKPMHYSELTEKIGTIGSKKVTKQSVHNELIKNEEFVLVGRGIYAMREWGYAPGVVEEVIVEVLTEANGPLPKKEIVKRVLERRIVKESTITLNLQRDRFKRVDKAIYTLN